MQVTMRTARTAIVRILAAIGAMVALVSVGDVPVSAVEGKALRGARVCAADPTATTTEYLLGVACPPENFEVTLGYAPILSRTSAGWRYLKPRLAGGGCSGPIHDTGPFWDFEDACRTHDYGYDLVRLGVGGRPEADRLLFLDMVASCEDRSLGAAFGCRAIARWTRVTLDIGESLRMDPAPVAHAVHGRRHEPIGSGYERVLMLGLVFGVLGLQVVKVQRVPQTHTWKEVVMKRGLGTIGFATLGVGIAALIVAFFAAAVVRSPSSCHAVAACIAAADVLFGLLMISIVLGLPFGGWVGYRVSRTLFGRADPGRSRSLGRVRRGS